MPAPLPIYHNDGTGRDTFINYAGAYWSNPLPGGTYYRSTQLVYPAEPKWDGELLDETNTNATSLSLLQSQHPGQQLFGKSRYGTTVLRSERIEDGAGAEGVDGGDRFDAEATALERVPNDVADPERRLDHPGHAHEGIEGTGGGSTYNGVKDPWTEPKAVDNTLLRLAPTYESTTHHSLRTGMHYNEDQAPPHENTLPEKGTNWGKSRYYP
ncbi:hypothetical protein STCU_00358 [Strigomonas culicis]|uniref:Uncharacterized protein n=1 Tax=Strigomonas culicis TaxID=28005 RepID=S9UPL6_9TRYP|nr:hypothetical protein STCU_06780 [Strigomonas culicis]EPY32842.1 hypothetical protein STCU_02615 [Strigomonas culicis]EPY36885.1 hypothetical protein STCU_00358 [Strigomonas culicis]|eukprot:EPY25225.1 hypothetical protein STCU_06780 [Strigomonas culicis]